MPALAVDPERGLLYDTESMRVWRLTKGQLFILSQPTRHLILVQVLNDNDLLVRDNGSVNRAAFPNGHFSPFILTHNGTVHDVNYHYATHHRVAALYIMADRVVTPTTPQDGTLTLVQCPFCQHTRTPATPGSQRTTSQRHQHEPRRRAAAGANSTLTPLEATLCPTRQPQQTSRGYARNATNATPSYRPGPPTTGGTLTK